MTKRDIDTIADDLRTFVGVINVNQMVKTIPHLGIELGGCNDWLFVFGNENKNGVIDSVEISDSLGVGLNSHDFRLARLFIEVRQYFINRGITVSV